VWQLVEFVICWMLLDHEARLLILRELRNKNYPRIWQYGRGDVLLMGG